MSISRLRRERGQLPRRQAGRALPGARRRAVRGRRRAPVRRRARAPVRPRPHASSCRTRRGRCSTSVRAARRVARRDGRALLLVHAHPRRRVRGHSASRSTRARYETGTRIAFGGRMDRSILEHEMAADYGALRELTARARRRGSRARASAGDDAGRAPTARST